MKCKKCDKRAIINLRQYNLKLCEDHFREFFLSRVEKAIKTYKLFTKKSKLLVAVSGGKDSLAVWDALAKLGYDVEGMFINLGIPFASDAAQKIIENFATERGLKLHVIYLKDLLGYTLPEAADAIKRSPCSLCGMIKRYVMNKFAYENNYDVLITGHNLDDEVAVLFKNLIRWEIDYIARQGPLLPKTHEKFVPKAKPLVFLTEKETYVYNIIENIKHVEFDCPFSKGATSIAFKESLAHIEYKQPGSKLYFYKTFLKKAKKLFNTQKNVELKECKICGFPTTEEICSFCRLKERLEEVKKDGKS